MTTIKKPLLFLIPLFLLTYTVNAQIVLEKILLLENTIEILVPNGFSFMSPEMIESRFPALNPKESTKTDWVITDKTGAINMAYNYSPIAMDDNHIPGYADILMKGLRADRKDIQFIDDGVLLQDGKNIGYIKFMSDAREKKVFNFAFYISHNDRLLIFNFICLEQLRTTWEAKAEEIANSIRVKS